MSDLQGLHSQAKRLILSLRTGLERLEGAESKGIPSGEMSNDMRTKLTDLLKTSQQLDTQYRMQVLNESSSKKGIWKRKVEHVTEETDFLRLSLERFAGREERRNQEAAARDELMRRSVSGAMGGEIEPAPGGGDDEAAMAGSISNSKRALEDAFSQGAAILTDMTQQRERLKATKRKVLDVLTSIGLSDSLLRMIDRRQRLDAIIVYGGMLLVVVVLLMLWWFFRA